MIAAILIVRKIQEWNLDIIRCKQHACRWSFGCQVLFAALFYLFCATSPLSAEPSRGEYVMKLAGCADCHTDTKNKGQPLAGGRTLKTPFGTFFSPNITMDKSTGIGDWTESQFLRAMQHGQAADGTLYYPAFPYPAYTKMTPDDLTALWQHLREQAPVNRLNKPHDLKFPFNYRFLLWPWRWLYFRTGEQAKVADKDDAWHRGRYILEALSHCGECHTPRNLLGGLDKKMHLAGTTDGPGGLVPNITPEKETGIGRWSADDLETFFSMGMLPDGDFAGGEMAAVLDNTGALSPTDLNALVSYLQALPPVKHKLSRKKPDS